MPTAADVIAGKAKWSAEQSDALEWLRGLPDDSVDLLFTSPPYSDARTYGIKANRKTAQWVEWMRPIVREACRVTRGLVFLNVSDEVDGEYKNGPEWLHADLTRLDGLAAVRPYIWHKANPDDGDDPRNGGQPGSGGKHFHRNCWEPVYGYAFREKLPPRWSNNTAFGAPPKWATGGKMTQRLKDGSRMNTGRMQKYGPAGQPAICNPGNVIRAMVGGGHLGHVLAHETDAPMPLAVAERFVCWFAPPGGIVGDFFCGSGTTIDAAVQHGRRGIGCDIRESQVHLVERRMRTVTAALFAS